MKKYNFLKYVTLSLVLLSTSCENMLDVKPRQSIDSATALTTKDAISGAVNGVYDRLQSTNLYGRDFVAIPEALADNGRATNKSGRLNPEFNNQAGSHFVNWATSYIAINQTNLIIDALPTVVDMTQAEKDAAEGECKFLRALLYFDLMRAYAYEPNADVPQYNRGGVPLMLTGVIEPSQITYPERATTKAVYDQMYKDLTDAIAKIPASRKNIVYASQGAAQALFSRVALYNKDYATSVKQATDALASGVGRFVDNAGYIQAWRVAQHPESMFEVIYTTPENIGVNTSLQTTYTTLVELGNRTRTGGFGDLVPTANLLAALESEKEGTKVLDIRRQLYELGTAGRGTAEIECTKFFGKNGAVNLDNVPVIRFSELYFNRAEANYMLGNEADALRDLNIVRTRAGLPAKTATDLKGQPLLDEILKQKRLEFAFEGHRWFDLKRRGQDIVKLPLTIPFTDFRILAQIPTGEINNNPKLRQNFGY